MTKCYIGFMALVLFMAPCIAQNVAINEDGSLPDPKAILDIRSSNKGVLIPRMSTADRQSLVGPKGLLVYDTTTLSFWYSTGPNFNNTASLWQSLATGSTAWSLSGNWVDTAAFLGTIDAAALKIRVFNQRSGHIDPFFRNTFWGYRAGFSDPESGSAMYNTATGSHALYSNTTGNFNTATGSYALYSSTGGAVNTAIGSYALRYNTTGNYNTAIGGSTLGNNTTGIYNTATGAGSLYDNTTGTFNTATGVSAMNKNTDGHYNTANGYLSLNSNTTGNYNTAIGHYSLHTNSTGSYNTAIGYNATVVTENLSNATAIGYAATVNASNKVRIGNSFVTVIEGQVPFTTPSDGRFKFQVKEDVKGLDFILQLRPVTYQFDVKRFDVQYSQVDTGNESRNGNYALQASYDEAARIRRSGFIAQEVEKAAMVSGYNFSGIIQPKTAQEHYSLSYESFVVPLVKSVQEQQVIIGAQQKKIKEQQQANEEQDKVLANLQQQLSELKQLVQGSK
jgi:trimeric autotransporter adhesin